MNKSLKRFLLMFAVLCVFVCGLVFAVACGDNGDPTGTGGEPEQKVTYSVSVTTDTDLDLTTVKAQWKSGSQAVGDAIALNAEGKASVELESGDYTVDLVGVDADKYVYQPANVTATAPDATITITAKPPVSTSHNVIISVTVPAGITLPADAGVQLYKDGTAEGTPVTIANNTAMVTVPNGTGYTIGLVNLPDYLGWGTAQAVADTTTTLTFTIAYADVEYTVNVSVEGDTDGAVAAELTVTFYKDGTAVEGASALPVVSGKVTKTLVAGNYTVKIDNLAAKYTAGEVSVTESSREVTITASKIIYTVTLGALPANITEAQISGLKATLIGANGQPVGEAVTFEQNKATFNVPAAAYTVAISGGTGVDGILGTALTAENKEASVVLGAVFSDALTAADGNYIVSGSTAADAITLKAPAGEKKLYTVTWNTYGAGTVTVSRTETNTNIIAVGNNSLAVVMDGEAEESFTLVYSSAAAHKYMLTVASSAAPADGGQYAPIEEQQIVGKHTVADATEAYLRMPAPTATGSETTVSYDVVVPDGVELYYLGFNVTTQISQAVPVYNGMTVSCDVKDNANPFGTSYIYFYVKLAQAGQGAELSFTVCEGGLNGQTPFTAVELTVNEANSFTPEFASVGENIYNIWYKFTPAQSGDYRVDITSNEIQSAVIVTSFTTDGTIAGTSPDTQTAVNKVAGYALKYAFEGGKTYYLYVVNNGQYEVKVNVRDYAVEDGEIDKPIAVTGYGSTINTVDLPFDGRNYFKFVVTEESLLDGGRLTFTVWSRPASGARILFYSDSTYTTPMSPATLENDRIEVAFSGLTAGRTIYFVIEATDYSENHDADMTISFYISAPVQLGLGEDLQISGLSIAVGDQETPGSNEIDIVVEPGTYTLGYILQAEGGEAADFEIKVGSTTFTVNVPESGSAYGHRDITVAAGDKLTITNKNNVSARIVEMRLMNALQKIELNGDPVQLDMTKGSASLEVTGAQAGTYTLTWKFSQNPGDTVYINGNVLTQGSYADGDSRLGGFMDLTVQINENNFGRPAFTVDVHGESPVGTLTLQLINKVENVITIDTNPAAFTVKEGSSVDIYFMVRESRSNGSGGSTTTSVSAYLGTQYQLNYNVTGEETTLSVSGGGLSQQSITGKNYVKFTFDNVPKLTITNNGAEAITVDLSFEVYYPTYDISLDAPAEQVNITPDSKTYTTKAVFRFTEPVEAGAYAVTLENIEFNQDYITALHADWRVQVGETSVSFEENGKFYTAKINIPADCEKFIIYNIEKTQDFMSPNFGFTADIVLTTQDNIPDGNKEPEDPKGDIVVGTSAEITISSSNFSGVNKTVYLKAGSYKITISDDPENKVRVNESSWALGTSGNIIAIGGAREAIITVATANMYTLNFYASLMMGPEGDPDLVIHVLIETNVPTLELGVPYDLSFDTNKTTVEIPVDLEEGTYHVELDFANASWAISLAWYVEINGAQTSLGDSIFGYQPADVEIPAECKSITVGCGSMVSQAINISVTVTDPSAAPKCDMTVGETASVTVGMWGSSKTIYLEAGDYTATFGGSYSVINTTVVGEGIEYTKVGSFNAFQDGSVVAQGNVVEFKVTIAGVFTFNFNPNEAPPQDPVTVLFEAKKGQTEQGNTLVVGEQKDVYVYDSSYGMGSVDLTIHLTPGTYSIALSGNGSESCVVNSYDSAIYFEGQTAGGTIEGQFVAATEKDYVLNVAYIGESGYPTIQVLVTHKSDEVKGDFSLGETISVSVESWMESKKVIYLEAGTYKITLDKAYEQFSVIDDDWSPIISSGETEGTITVTEATFFVITFSSSGATVNNCQCTVTAAGGTQSGADLTLGEPSTIEFTGTSDPEEVVKTIQLEEGWYTITIVGDMANAMVLDSDETTVVYRTTNSGELHVEVTGLVELTFRHFGSDPLSITVTITAQ